MDIVRKERYKIFTTGLTSRMIYYSLHSTVLFYAISRVGRVFRVDLHD